MQALARYYNWNTETHIHAYGWFLRPHHGEVHECMDVYREYVGRRMQMFSAAANYFKL